MVVSRIQVRARTQLHLQYNNNCKQHSNSTVQQHNTPNFNSQFHNGDKAVLEELTHLTELSSGRPCLWNKSLTNISSIVWSPLGCYKRGSINNKRNWSTCQCLYSLYCWWIKSLSPYFVCLYKVYLRLWVVQARALFSGSWATLSANTGNGLGYRLFT